MDYAPKQSPPSSESFARASFHKLRRAVSAVCGFVAEVDCGADRGAVAGLGGWANDRVVRNNDLDSDSDPDSTLGLLKKLLFAGPLSLHPGFQKEAQPQFLGGSRLRLDVIGRAFAIPCCVSFGCHLPQTSRC